MKNIAILCFALIGFVSIETSAMKREHGDEDQRPAKKQRTTDIEISWSDILSIPEVVVIILENVEESTYTNLIETNWLIRNIATNHVFPASFANLELSIDDEQIKKLRNYIRNSPRLKLFSSIFVSNLEDEFFSGIFHEFLTENEKYLDGIKSFTYEDCYLDNDTFKGLSSLKNLETLELGNSAGLVNDHNCESIAKLSKLQKLSFDTGGKNITMVGLKALGTLVNLKELQIVELNVSGNLHLLENLANLKKLYLFRAKLNSDDFVILAKLSSLKELNIEGAEYDRDDLSRLQRDRSDMEINP